MIKFIKILGLTFFLSISAFAQRDIQLSQFAYSSYLINPSLAGTNGNLSLNAAARFQWVGLEGAPVSQLLGVDLPVPKLNSGWAVLFNNDILGAFTITSLKLSWAYHLNLKKQKTFSIGIAGGLSNHFLNSRKLLTPSGNYLDGNLTHNDLLIGDNENIAKIRSEFSVGANLNLKWAELGITYNDFGNRLNKLQKNGLASINSQNVTINAKYFLYLGNRWEVMPIVLFKTSFKYHQFDIQCNFKFDNFILFGIGYRGYNNISNDALIGLLGIKLVNNLRVIYSYDYALSSIRKVSSGSHELGIHYAFKTKFSKNSKVKKIYNPRFL